LNGNGTCDLDKEDSNDDGACSVADCRGSTGETGTSCWDSNSNHICDPSEDVNNDKACNATDCRGANGVSCWDTNANQTCDPNEDKNGDNACTVADCSGKNGTSQLVNISDEPKGSHCANGGVKLEIGVDDNADGKLTDTEIDDTRYVCAGTDGKDGVSATNGANGANGKDGGCGCRTTHSTQSPAHIVALFALIGVALFRHRGRFQPLYPFIL